MFTENQVRQFYVIPTGSEDSTNVQKPVKVDGNASPAVKATDLSSLADGACQFVIENAGDEAYMLYKGPLGGPQRSDLIKKCNVMDVRLSDARDLSHPVRTLQIVLDSNVSSTAVVGQDYVLNVEIKNYIATGYNSTKVKFGAARATATTADTLYKKLAISLAKNFSTESVPMVAIYLKTASSPVLVTSKDTLTTLTSTTATGILIKEVEQPWRRGVAKVEFVNFDAYTSTIYTGGADQVWGVVTDVTDYNKASSNSSYVFFTNSKQVADMEWFFHKERGDVYGEAGYPNNIDTVYQVVPTLAAGYSMVDIHYYFEGNSHNVGKSEKTLTIVGSKANLKRLIGQAYVPASGNDPAEDATGLYAFLDGTGVEIKTSANW